MGKQGNLSFSSYVANSRNELVKEFSLLKDLHMLSRTFGNVVNT